MQMEEDALSLRDLPIHEDGENSLRQSPRASSSPDLFEFFTGLSSGEFCQEQFDKNDEELNEYQKRDYLNLRSASFHKPCEYSLVDDQYVTWRKRSKSGRLYSSESYPSSVATASAAAAKVSSSASKVNITALTSMSAKSRRRMFMFGPVKFRPEMELSAIRERQGRRAPVPMFPLAEEEEHRGVIDRVGDGRSGHGSGKGYFKLAAVGGEAAAVGGGGCGGKAHWRLVKTLRYRSHLANVFSRSFGCVSTPIV